LKKGSRKGAEHRFRFGLPTVFAGRPSVGGIGLGCQPIQFAAEARFGARQCIAWQRFVWLKKPAADFAARAVFLPRWRYAGDLLDVLN
jgi:hypothetical protein